MSLGERIAKKLLDGYLTPRGVNELLTKELNEVAQLEAENDALGELLSSLVDVELERDNLKEENERLRKEAGE